MGIHQDNFADVTRFFFLMWQDSRMQFYRRNLPHLQRDFKPHFITFVTKFRWVLPDWGVISR
jgi:hypothetical protein